MLCQWPIRTKLFVGLGLLVTIVATLAASGFYGIYAYRNLVKSLSGRSMELALAAELSQQVSDMRVTLSSARGRLEFPSSADDKPPLDIQLLRERFLMNRQAIDETLTRYRDKLDYNRTRAESQIDDDHQERETLRRIETVLARIDAVNHDQDWMLNELKSGELATEVESLHRLAAELPSYLRQRLAALSDDVRLQYRTAIILTWVASIAAFLTLIVLVRLFYTWIFRPLRVLINGSRQVAAGRFNYRIGLDTRDEMSELADAMNHMTSRFQAIRDDLDQKVRQRTRQVVRSEQLASVGFLAAGVAHEINNPLASIALSSESLEDRVLKILGQDDEEYQVIRRYLRMIQDEAFRCKEITEKLLDFSRRSEAQYQRTDLRELVQNVIEIVGHMKLYKSKSVELSPGEPVFAQVSPQEMKQVVLNLVCNGLDSVAIGGKVAVEVTRSGEQAEMIFTDNGCGMTDEVLEHLFEPFFTRKTGGQGTGLGLSISYNIVADHHGHIEAASAGPGQGSRFVVDLPCCMEEKEPDYQYQAA